MLVSIKHNAHIVAKVVNPLGTVVTVPNDQEDLSGSEEPLEDAVIHENCDEALFRPVVGVRPVVCLQPKIAQPEINKKEEKVNKNQRYQGLKSSEIVRNVEERPNEKPSGKKRKSKQKQETKTDINSDNVVQQLPVKDLCSSLEKILFSEDKDEQKEEGREMWSSIEKLLPEQTSRSAEEEPSKDMWSSIEHCKAEEETTKIEQPTDIKVEKSDDDVTPNNNSSETTESDDSTKNKILVSVNEEFPAEENTACNASVSATQSATKTSKKKAKKKRK